MVRIRSGWALLAVAVVVAALAGCTKVATPGSNGASVLPTILSSHHITIAVEPGGAPYDSVGKNGKPTGFDVDIANAIAQSLGAKATIKVVTGPGRVAALQSKQVQIEVADFTATPARSQTISFSKPYLLPKGQFMVKAGRADIKTYQDLDKKSVKICVGQGGTATQLIPLSLPKATITTLNSAADCAQAVKNGQVDATSQDELTNYGLMKANPNAFQVVPGGYFTTAMITVGLQFNDFAMQNYVNTFINDYVATNKMQALFEKWWPGFKGTPPIPTVN